MLPRFADNTDAGSWAARLRSRRAERFAAVLDRAPRPLRIVDIGGSPAVWHQLGLADAPDVLITVVNLEQMASAAANITCIVADARDLSAFPDRAFDVAYSNSVLEHVGGPADCARMAAGLRRVADRYFVQTPNRYFPVEPHFVFPMFQFLPRPARVELVRRWQLGWMPREPDRDQAAAAVDSIRLLTRRELRTLFPDAVIEAERIAGVTKSWIAIRA